MIPRTTTRITSVLVITLSSVGSPFIPIVGSTDVMPVTFVNGYFDLGVVFESLTPGVSVALTLVGDSLTWLVNECEVCELMMTGVVADVVPGVNCGVGAGAGKEKRHGMRKFISTTQHTWPQCFTALIQRHYPLKKNHDSLDNLLKQVFIHWSPTIQPYIIPDISLKMMKVNV